MKSSNDDVPELRSGVKEALAVLEKAVTTPEFIKRKVNVVFEDTAFVQYSFLFTRDGQKLGIYRFVIKETRHGRR